MRTRVVGTLFPTKTINSPAHINETGAAIAVGLLGTPFVINKTPIKTSKIPNMTATQPISLAVSGCNIVTVLVKVT